MPTEVISQHAATPAAAQRAGAEQGAADGQDAARALSSDFETFLLMLTTQLENQDPLNPIESQDFAVQLATFSGVEQQVRTNDLLEGLASALGASGLAQLAGWVGMEARVAAPVAYDGTPVEIAISPEPGSDGAILIVENATGEEVARSEVPLGEDTLFWTGLGPDDAPLPAGSYALSLASVSQGEVIGVAPVQHYARIVEARQGNEGIELVIAGGEVVSSEGVTALREPQAVIPEL